MGRMGYTAVVAVMTPLTVAVGLYGCRGPGSSLAESGSGETVRVYKSAGQVQCENTGTPVTVMAQALVTAGVDVICGERGIDGRAYPAVCGANSGAINVYEILRSDLPDAEALGFAPVRELVESNAGWKVSACADRTDTDQ